MSVWCLNGLMRRSKQHLCLFKTLRRNEAILAEPMLALTSEQRIDGNSRQSPDTAQPPRAKTNAQISNHRELCAASDNVGANCVLTAGLIPLRKISEPVAGDQFGDVASYLLRADQLLHGSQSGRLDFSPETRMICCEATAWWVSLSL
jgi:hypothetical protein